MFGAHSFTTRICWFLLASSFILSCTQENGQEQKIHNWEVYRGTADAQQFSDLDQIHKGNVHLLEPAWVFHTGDNAERSPMECNPIIVGNTMYLTSASLDLIAVHAANGKPVWRFEAEEKITGVNRGVTYFDDGAGGRIFFSVGFYLYAINAENGQVIRDFGKNGRIDLRESLGKDPANLSVTLTSPAAIYDNLLILGSATGEGYDASP